MARIPVRFERVAAAFDADVARRRICESSGSEHSPDHDGSLAADLSDLVNSFLENSNNYYQKGDPREEDEASVAVGGGEEAELDAKSECSDSVNTETIIATLQDIFNGYGSGCDDEDEMNARQKIRGEVELACGFLGQSTSLPEFKRRLMSRLRQKGLDAGLCKSKWDKNGRITAGHYEYVDVLFSGNRYIVEVSLAAEFQIARPTTQYASLLEIFPHIFVGRVEELKRVVRFMCNSIKGSMKSRDLHVPPWRRHGYMQAKWFGSYKRTTNAVSTRKGSSSPFSPESLFPQRSIGFEPRSVKAQNCRDDYYASKTGFRIGHLTAAFSSDGFGMQS